ncbi:hypothetical protein ACFQ6C_15305 [Streptomyces sp. NPDC056454]|uniref:hypothetical protein n=1 Tax=Streptomyces sp. NPDC056454 TaxID=3345823 RepID=UPI00368F9E3B
MTTHHERTNDPLAYGHALAGPPLDVLVPPHHLAMIALALLAAVAVSATPDRSTDPNRPVRSSDPSDLTIPEIRHIIGRLRRPSTTPRCLLA